MGSQASTEKSLQVEVDEVEGWWEKAGSTFPWGPTMGASGENPVVFFFVELTTGNDGIMFLFFWGSL